MMTYYAVMCAKCSYLEVVKNAITTFYLFTAIVNIHYFLSTSTCQWMIVEYLFFNVHIILVDVDNSIST